MSSTTIRYSTLPENSQSIGLASAHPSPPDPRTGLHHSEADPGTPGARRYDPTASGPDAYDPSIPDSDPRSPRYEPPHLRHRPGDTFEIGGRPHDPLDPGPYGSPGWFQDRRTGRHRRGELPDPLPDAEPDGPRPIPSPAPPVDEERPSPHRRRRWDRPEQRSAYEPRHSTRAARRDADELHRLPPLREGAMQRFLELSQPFRDAHFQPQPPTFGARVLWLLRWLRCIAACGLIPSPSRPAAECRSMLADTGPGAAATAAPVVDTGGSAATGAGPSHLHGTPRQERPRSVAARAPYIAAWERRFDAQFPARARLHTPVAGGGLL